jgi:NADPH-dependent glutamate synthase beta subunit-like oxidoreductase
MNAPTPPPTAWTTGSTEVFKTGTWRAALPVYRQAPSPCHLACPVGGEIAAWLGHARNGDWQAAWTTLVENNPFPAVAGRVCHHPCELACNRSAYDEPLAICAMERFVGDRALAEGWSYPAIPIDKKEKVAIVGGGPSGLSAAYQLRRRGYRITIFEGEAQLGGLLRSGIPPYRLPRAALDGEIERLLRLGVEVRPGAPIDAHDDFLRLREDYSAVYLALGARRQKRLRALDYSDPRVMDSARYLALSNAGTPPKLGEHVVVVGGGSAAMDVARSAARAGHDVTVLSLEREAQLPAQREEVLEAKQEGVLFFDGAQLDAVAATPKGALLLKCRRVSFRLGRSPGEFEVTPLASGDFVMAADAVVCAIGQDPDLAPVQSLLETQGPVVRIDAHGATTHEGVFAGGDVATNARFVTQAIGMGKRAALQIDRWLRREQGPRDEARTAVAADAVNTAYHPHAKRAAHARVAASERLDSFAEVQLGLAETEAQREAARCFSCGHCTFCDNCFSYCPDMAVQKLPGAYRIAADYCKGCGLCVRECPTGSIAMQAEWK